jgi:hypothetical protein
MLADYYLGDPRLVLVPIEHLTPSGMTPEFAALLRERCGWDAAHIALFDAGFARYWTRSSALAARTDTWPPPRLRHVAVVTEPLDVRPYTQLLNTSAWTVYASDFDPALSHPEFAAYVFVHGDRMAVSGEVTSTPVHCAAYWFERSEEECAAFAAAAACAARPDAAGFQAIADAIGWLRELRHETLRPMLVLSPHRAIPRTGLLVPSALEARPLTLAAAWGTVAEQALAAYRTRWRGGDPRATRELCGWLAADAPRLVVTGQRGRTVWDPERPERLDALRAELRDADGAAVQAIAADLHVIDQHTRAFHAALADPAALPAPAANTEQSGYTYLHRERRLIAYNLHEAGMERLAGPPLPYERFMVGARTAHEWAHLADTAGWVPRTVTPERWKELRASFAAQMDAVIGAAPPAVRRRTSVDLETLAADGSPGAALGRILVTRMPDYRANLVARLFMPPAEKETYVRHNIRTLRPAYGPGGLWRMLVRYLYEYQYLGRHLGLTAVADARTFFVQSTWFERDFFATGVLDEERFAALADAVAQLCAGYAVDTMRIRIPGPTTS